MSRFNNILHSLFAFCIVAVLCGCSSDSVPDVEEIGSGSFYLRLHLSTNGEGGTRAVEDHPYGGETGDGTEEVDAAHPHEDDIHDLTIYIYNGTGVNDVATTPIKASQYISGLSLTSTTGYYTTDPIEIKNKDYVKAAGDKIIVLANMGDQSGKTKLGEVRDLLVNTAWARNGSSIKDYYYFAMSSTSDGTLDTSTDGSYSDPFVGDAYIERVAARIDFWLIKNVASGTDYASYEVGTASEKDEFRLSHVRIVNGSQMPTYNLKRTATAVNPLGTVTYLGDETAGTAVPHIPTNYVVEPLTTKKNGSAVISNTILNAWFGASSLKNSTSLDFLNNNESKIASHVSEQFTTVESDAAMDALDDTSDGKITCYTLGYVMENTMDKTGQIPQFATGLELKGTFVPHPEHVQKLEAGSPKKDDSYTAGSDFWYYENGTDPTEKIIFSNEADATTYESMTGKAGTIKHYVKGECYYYVWIRHAMFGSGTGEGTGEFPMEYGIVRNNIYRIGVRKVEFIGTEVPDPGATPLTSAMYVREWRLRKESEIVL